MYELYGLTQDEMWVVKGAADSSRPETRTSDKKRKEKT